MWRQQGRLLCLRGGGFIGSDLSGARPQGERGAMLEGVAGGRYTADEVLYCCRCSGGGVGSGPGGSGGGGGGGGGGGQGLRGCGAS